MTLGRLIELYKAEQEGKQIILRIIQFTLSQVLSEELQLLPNQLQDSSNLLGQ